MTLYEISQDLHALEEILTETGGEIPDGEIGEQLESWFAQVGEAYTQKLDNMAALIRHFESLADAAALEAKRLSALAAMRDNAAKRLKERVKQFLIEHSISKLATPRFSLSVANNGGALPLAYPKAWDANPEQIPAAFKLVRYDVNKEALREALRNDSAPDGVSLGERGNHLRIK